MPLGCRKGLAWGKGYAQGWVRVRVRAMDCVPNRDKMTPIGTYFF